MDYNQFKKSVPESLLAAVDEAMRGSQTSPKTPSGDEKPPFDKPFAKAGPRKDRYGNPVKNVARHLARKGLAMHRVAESNDEAYITEGSVGYKHYTITGGQPHDLRNEVGAPEHVAADLRKLKNLGVHANEGDGEKYGHVTKVTVTNNQTGEKSHHHVYQRDMSRNQQRPVFSVRHLSKPHPEHINVLKHYIAGKTKIKDSLGLYETSSLQEADVKKHYVMTSGREHRVVVAGDGPGGSSNPKTVKAFPYGDTQSKLTSPMQHAAAHAFAKKMNAGIKKDVRVPNYRSIAVEEDVEQIDELSKNKVTSYLEAPFRKGTPEKMRQHATSRLLATKKVGKWHPALGPNDAKVLATEDSEETVHEAYPTAASLARKSKAIKQARAVATGYANQKSGKWASQSYKTDDGRWASKDVKEEAEGLDELTKKTLQSYIAKAGKDRTKQLGNERKYENRMKGSSQAVAKLAKASPDKDLEDYKNWRKTQHNDKKTTNDIITKKTPYHEEVESIDELSKGLLTRYELKNERDRERLASGLWYRDGVEPTEKQKKDSAKLDKRLASNLLAAKKMSPTVFDPKVTGRPGAKVHATEEAGQLDESVAKVRKALEAPAHSMFPDSIGKNKDGHIVVRKGFYYKHGKTAAHQTAQIKRALDDAGVKHTIVKDGEHNAPFRGGASVGRQSHFYTHIKLHEDMESIDELSKKTLVNYLTKASDQFDRAGEGKLTPQEDAKNRLAKKKIGDRRIPGMEKAVNKLNKEEVEAIDELSAQTKDSYVKKAVKQLPGLFDQSGKTAEGARKYYNRKNTVRKIANEDVEEIAELRAATIDSYRKKAYDQQPAGDDGSPLYKKRKTGRDLAFKKVTHGAKIMATEEEVKRGRGRPSKASLDIEDEPEALGMQLRKAKSINKPVTFNNKETKQIDPKHLFAFNNHMDARRTTQEKHAFQKKASASHADFVKAVSEPVPARAKDTGEIIRYGQGRY